MSFQDIRKYYEYPVIDCCNLSGIEYRAENTLEPGGDAIHKFCLARLQFGEMAEQTIACGPLSNKRAVFIVEYYGPKGIGPADAQDFMECILCRFHELQGVVSINGPDFTSLDNRPYFFARVSFGLQIPGTLGGTVWDGGGSGTTPPSTPDGLTPHRLTDHIDVNATIVLDGNTLIYDSAAGAWVNKPGVDGGDIDTP